MASFLEGHEDYQKFLKGEKIPLFKAVRAHCYVCNGMETGGVDCKGKSCPLYPYFPYKGEKNGRDGNTDTGKQLQTPAK